MNVVKNSYSGCISAAKVGKHVSPEFEVTECLRHGCSLVPAMFKIYLDVALKIGKGRHQGMGTIKDGTLYTLLFADDHIIIASDIEDASDMLRKLSEQCAKCGLTI